MSRSFGEETYEKVYLLSRVSQLWAYGRLGYCSRVVAVCISLRSKTSPKAFALAQPRTYIARPPHQGIIQAVFVWQGVEAVYLQRPRSCIHYHGRNLFKKRDFDCTMGHRDSLDAQMTPGRNVTTCNVSNDHVCQCSGVMTPKKIFINRHHGSCAISFM